MLFGYARAATDDKKLARQRAALTAAGCGKIFEDKIPGSARKRTGLAHALNACAAGDVLVVWRLDRLDRSLGDLSELLTGLAARGVQFRSLTEPIDTTAPAGKRDFHVIGALAESERALIAERTRAGLKAAKARGVQLGRKPSLTVAQAKQARRLLNRGKEPRSVARDLGVDRATMYRHLAKLGG
jgi:DNA invertase Pin-like site-specific DNA recombinase